MTINVEPEVTKWLSREVVNAKILIELDDNLLAHSTKIVICMELLTNLVINRNDITVRYGGDTLALDEIDLQINSSFNRYTEIEYEISFQVEPRGINGGYFNLLEINFASGDPWRRLYTSLRLSSPYYRMKLYVNNIKINNHIGSLPKNPTNYNEFEHIRFFYWGAAKRIFSVEKLVTIANADLADKVFTRSAIVSNAKGIDITMIRVYEVIDPIQLTILSSFVSIIFGLLFIFIEPFLRKMSFLLYPLILFLVFLITLFILNYISRWELTRQNELISLS